jgi:hypothetical protein
MIAGWNQNKMLRTNQDLDACSCSSVIPLIQRALALEKQWLQLPTWPHGRLWGHERSKSDGGASLYGSWWELGNGKAPWLAQRSNNLEKAFTLTEQVRLLFEGTECGRLFLVPCWYDLATDLPVWSLVSLTYKQTILVHGEIFISCSYRKLQLQNTKANNNTVLRRWWFLLNQ